MALKQAKSSVMSELDENKHGSSSDYGVTRSDRMAELTGVITSASATGSPSSNETEWTVFLYEIHHSSVRYLYNRQEIVKAATREEALEKSKLLERGDTHVIGVSLIPTAQYNELNCHSWKW
jgi:hypothetical protein